MHRLSFEIIPSLDGIRMTPFTIEAPKTWSTDVLDFVMFNHYRDTVQLQERITELQKKQKKWWQRGH